MSFRLDSAGVWRVEAWQELPWLRHGFTTRQTGDFAGPPEPGTLNGLGVDGMQLTTVRQVHSGRVYLLGPDERPWEHGQRPEADALLTAREGCLLGVRTADCLPLLLVDRHRRAVAAVHAGWRGTQQEIARHAVEQMRAAFGSPPEALEAAIGPGIEACCFEVGPEVAELFDPSLVVAPDGNPGRETSSQRRPHINLVEANRRQLLQQGIPAGHIWSSGRCTFCEGDDFFSYRRDGEKAGRMLAFVGVVAGRPTAGHG